MAIEYQPQPTQVLSHLVSFFTSGAPQTVPTKPGLFQREEVSGSNEQGGIGGAVKPGGWPRCITGMLSAIGTSETFFWK